MCTVSEMVKRLTELNIDGLAKQSLGINSNVMTDLIKEQLTSGYSAKGKIKPKYRNPTYARMKSEMNALPGNGTPDLRLTGAFYNSIQVDIGGQDVEFLATDSKSESLTEKYGDEVLGMSEKQHNYLIEEPLFITFIGLIKEKTGLN